MSRQPVAYILFGAGAMIAVAMEMLAGSAAHLRPRDVPAARAQYAGARRAESSRTYVNKRSEIGRRRARPLDARTGRHHRVGPDGRRGARRRLRRGAAPRSRWYREDLIKLPFYDNDPVSQIVSAVGFVLLCLYLWFGSHEEGEAGLIDRLGSLTATALLGIDTLWGGDVMNPSGTGRAVVDSWFSDEPLPAAYTHPRPARRAIRRRRRRERARPRGDRRLSRRGRREGSDRRGRRRRRRRLPGLRGAPSSTASSQCLSVDVGPLDGDPGARPGRAVRALRARGDRPAARALPARGEAPRRLPSCSPAPATRRRTGDELLAAVDAWRRERMVPAKSIATLADAFIAQLRRRHDAASRAAPAGGPARRPARQHEVRARSRTHGSRAS